MIMTTNIIRFMQTIHPFIIADHRFTAINNRSDELCHEKKNIAAVAYHDGIDYICSENGHYTFVTSLGFGIISSYKFMPWLIYQIVNYGSGAR